MLNMTISTRSRSNDRLHVLIVRIALVLCWASGNNASHGFLLPIRSSTSNHLKITPRTTDTNTSSRQAKPDFAFGVDNDTRESITAKLEDELEQQFARDTDDTTADEAMDLFASIKEASWHVFNQRLPTIKLDRTMIGPSTLIPGQRGLFASCDCKEGDLLTCYPGDLVILIPDDEDEDYEILTGNHLSEAEKIIYQDPEYDISDELMGYLLHATEDHGVLGLPTLDDNPSYFGHFANDGALKPTQAKDLESYIAESIAKANVRHDRVSCHMVTVATRDITKGEEIFVSYGAEYWMDHSDNYEQ